MGGTESPASNGGLGGWRAPRRFPGAAAALPAQDWGGKAELRQSPAGCQSTGGGSVPCLMMLA